MHFILKLRVLRKLIVGVQYPHKKF